MAKKKKANKVGLTATEIRNDPWRRVIAHPTRKAQKVKPFAPRINGSLEELLRTLRIRR